MLALDYRPTTFEEVVSQPLGVKVLQAITKRKNVRVILLEGQHGIGKTTLARIFARNLNCQLSPDICSGDTLCNSCRAFVGDRHPDIIQLDFGGSGLVEDAKQLKMEARVVPTWNYRVFILDEVHGASKRAFDTLLTTLESPPRKAFFVLATTAPDEVPFTIVSRTLRVPLFSIPHGEIADRIMVVCEKEGVSVTKRIATEIAKNARGSMRDALMLLDRMCLLAKDNEITHDVLSQEPWFISEERAVALTQSLLKGDEEEYFKQTNLIVSEIELTNILRIVLDWICTAYVKKSRRSDFLIDALWTAFVRAKQGYEAEIVIKSLWIEIAKR